MADFILAQPTPSRNIAGEPAEGALDPASAFPLNQVTNAGSRQERSKKIGKTPEVLKAPAVSPAPPLYQRLISYTSVLLVFLLAAGAFILSYATLWDTALSYGLPPRLAWIWPLLVDFALVVFSLAVVRASLYGERTLWPWLMVALYTAATVAFNVLHAPDHLTAQIVAVVAPVSLFLSFETLMAMLKAEVKRKQVSLPVESLPGQWQGWQQRLEQHQAELSGYMERWQAQVKRLDQQLAQMERQLADQAAQLNGPENRPEGSQDQVRGETLEGQAGPDPVQPPLTPARPASLQERREQVQTLLRQGLSQAAMATHLGVSLSTIKRDLAALQVEPEADPQPFGGKVDGVAPLRGER